MMRRMLQGLLPGMLLATVLAGGAWAETAFDPPTETRRVGLGPTDTVPPEEKQLICSYFPNVMVKELDFREVGAERLSVVALRAGEAPPCETTDAQGERTIDPDAWSGHFAGAKAGYLFFWSGDGANGGLGFAVFDAGLRKVFEDDVKLDTDLHFGPPGGAGLSFRYQRVLVAKCSIPTGGAGCWRGVAGTMKLPAGTAMPDCAGAYAASRREMAAAYCAANDHRDAGGDAACQAAQERRIAAEGSPPSVLGVQVEVTLGGSGARSRVLGGPASCWPAD